MKTTQSAVHPHQPSAALAAIHNVIRRGRAFLVVAMMLASVPAGFGQSGVNLEPTSPPNYTRPLNLFMSNGKIVGAWAVRNRGTRNSSPFEVGIYINGKRQLVAKFSSGLKAGSIGFDTKAPFDILPDGESIVELRVNDSRWTSETSYTDNVYALRVTVNRGGNGGTNPPKALTRAEAAYKFPSKLGSSSVSQILSRGNDMFVATWVPASDFVNWRVGKDTGAYYKGVRYYGLPYSQSNPQTDVTGFMGYLPSMRGTLNSTSAAGPDCSGFISIVWELTTRQTTWTFDQPSSLFTTVVAPWSLVRNASKIQPGDVITSSSWGHCVIVLSAPKNGKVEVLESTASKGVNANGNAQDWAVVRNVRALSDLEANGCRVIRRNLLK
jgi:hypothetical protein